MYDLNNVSSEKLEEAINNSINGIEKYLEIMKLFKNTNVINDNYFQKKFNGFYRIRQRPNEFYKIYYEFMENNKENKKISFNLILTYFYNKLGRIEPSFSSKLLATINAKYPIWDKFILKNLGVKTPNTNSKNRLNKTIDLYNEINNWYDNYLNLNKTKDTIRLFDSIVPNHNLISNTKKIDFILWQIR